VRLQQVGRHTPQMHKVTQICCLDLCIAVLNQPCCPQRCCLERLDSNAALWQARRLCCSSQGLHCVSGAWGDYGVVRVLSCVDAGIPNASAICVRHRSSQVRMQMRIKITSSFRLPKFDPIKSVHLSSWPHGCCLIHQSTTRTCSLGHRLTCRAFSLPASLSSLVQ
jgi:hypothetical protein